MKNFKTNTRKSIMPGIAFTLLVLSLSGCDILSGCNPGTVTDATCIPNDTKIQVSTSQLTFLCPDGIDCLTEYTDKIEIVRHGELIIEDPTNPFYDPIFTGIHVHKDWEDDNPGHGSSDCNEPPPPPGGGDAFVPSLKRQKFPESEQSQEIYHFASILEGNSEFDKIFFLITCQDTGYQVGRPFLSASVFDGNFDDLLNRYKAFPAALGYTPGGDRGHIVEGISTGSSKRAFRILTQIGHHITIVETDDSNKILRFGHRSPTRFEQSVEIVP